MRFFVSLQICESPTSSGAVSPANVGTGVWPAARAEAWGIPETQEEVLYG